MYKLNFAENLSRYMRKKNIKGRALADATGLCETSISRYRKGRIVPDGVTAAAIAEALGVPAAAMWADNEQQADLIVAMADPDMTWILHAICFHGILGDQGGQE